MTYEPRWYVSWIGAEPQGPWTKGEVVRRIVERRVGRGAVVCAEGTGDWVDVADIVCFGAALTAAEKDDWSLGEGPAEAPVDLVRPRSRAVAALATRECVACREDLLDDAAQCPHCGEPVRPPSVVPPVVVGAPRLHRFREDLASSLRRLPRVARLGFLACGLAAFAGVAAMSLRGAPPRVASAPERPSAASSFAATPERTLSHGFVPVGERATDVLAVGDRLLVATRAGVEVRDLGTGQLVTLIADAPGVASLVRVGPTVYAAGDRAVFVLDVEHARLLRRVDMRASVGRPAVNADATRVLLPLPAAKGAATIATEYHAEIRRARFDEGVASVEWSPDGTRALALTGRVATTIRRWGWRTYRRPARAVGTSVYAFAPISQGSQQEHVRLAVGAQPWSAAFLGNDRAVVALRGEDALVELAWDASGAVRIGSRRATCSQPEQVEVIPGTTRVAVRCAAGRLVEIRGESEGDVRRVDLPGPGTAMVVSASGAVLWVAFGEGQSGGVVAIEAATGSVRRTDLGAPLAAIALAADGHTLMALSAVARRVDLLE